MDAEDKKKEDVVRRLEEILKALNLKSSRQLALAIGMDPSQMNKVLRYEIGFPFNQAEKIQKKFKINSNWIMTGEGDMRIKNPHIDVKIEVSDLVKDNIQLKALVKTLYNRVAKHESKIYGISIDEVLNQMDDDTTISLKELVKEQKQ